MTHHRLSVYKFILMLTRSCLFCTISTLYLCYSEQFSLLTKLHVYCHASQYKQVDLNVLLRLDNLSIISFGYFVYLQVFPCVLCFEICVLCTSMFFRMKEPIRAHLTNRFLHWTKKMLWHGHFFKSLYGHPLVKMIAQPIFASSLNHYLKISITCVFSKT